jgi:hypothetical protein
MIIERGTIRKKGNKYLVKVEIGRNEEGKTRYRYETVPTLEDAKRIEHELQIQRLLRRASTWQ